MTYTPAVQRTSTRSALIAIGLTVVLWASAFPAIRAGLVAFKPTELAALRFVVASVVLGVFALVTGLGLPRLRDLPMIIISGITGISLYHLALNTGEVTVSAGMASFLINTAPIFTALLAFIFLSERLNKWGVLGIAVSFAGVIMLAIGEEGGLQISSGALFVLAASFLQALYFVLQKPLLRTYTPLQLTTYVIWGGTVFLLPFAADAIAIAITAPPSAVAAVMYLGIFPGAVAYVAWNFALARYPAGKASAFLYVTPPVAIMIAFVWLGEIPTILGVVGGLVMLAGVAVLTWRGKA